VDHLAIPGAEQAHADPQRTDADHRQFELTHDEPNASEKIFSLLLELPCPFPLPHSLPFLQQRPHHLGVQAMSAAMGHELPCDFAARQGPAPDSIYREVLRLRQQARLMLDQLGDLFLSEELRHPLSGTHSRQ